MPSTGQNNPLRRGITLIELLVVVSILMILLIVAMPVLTPSLESRRIREAARAINVYLGAARNHAVETGRPVGVMFQRVDRLPQAAMTLYQVEVPAPYAGDTTNTTVQLQVTDRAAGKLEAQRVDGEFSSGLAHVGDFIRIDYQGPLYRITYGPEAADGSIDDFSSTPLKLDLYSSQAISLPWPDSPSWSSAMPFEIIRQPIGSAAAPLELPAGAVVDLTASGTDTRAVRSDVPDPVVIMFAPNGSVERAYCGQWVVLVTEPIYLLVGKRERVGLSLGASPTREELPNWADPTSLWVTLNPQNGLVKTSENGPVDLSGINWNQPDTWVSKIFEARSIAREIESIGGR